MISPKSVYSAKILHKKLCYNSRNYEIEIKCFGKEEKIGIIIFFFQSTLITPFTRSIGSKWIFYGIQETDASRVKSEYHSICH